MHVHYIVKLTSDEREALERLISGGTKTLLVALACSAPPLGRSRWTLQLLADEFVQLESIELESVSADTIGRRLAEKEIKPWQKKMWCIPAVTAEFVERMEDVLELYAEPSDSLRPTICFDERPCQLIGETRVPIPMKPGQPQRIDYEYQRNGVANIFMMVGAGFAWRQTKVTAQRTAIDFAEVMRDLVDIHFPHAGRIRVVMDNLNTHSAKNLYEAFPAPEARRILRRLEFHYTPKHASWLNMAEIEIGVLSGQCLDRRIASQAELEVQVEAWTRARNESGARINWMFDVASAREKLGRAYPVPLHGAIQAAA